MAKIKIKPISVNDCWQGRRFKTPLYKAYEEEMLYRLPKMKIPPGKLFLKIEVGFSNKASDIDNMIKPFLDILQKKYDFNDKNVYLVELAKEDVKKGDEYIQFDISSLE